MIVVDASVVVTALADAGPDGMAARRRLVSEQLLAPHLIDIEVTSAFRRLVSAGQLADDRARQAFADLRVMRIERVPHGPLLARCWSLRANLTTYDAAYVALAEHAGVSLVTGDAKLANAPGVSCTVELLQVD